MHGDAQMVTAYAAALQAFAAMAVRNLLAAEADDPEVGAVVVECQRDGAVSVTLLGTSGQPVGGYSL
jgi:hypothetical protein